MKKILCPTDFSEASGNGIAYAAKLAQVMKADLTLLHVQSVFDLTPAEVMRGTRMAVAGLVDELEAACREVSRAFKIICHADVLTAARKLSTIIRQKAGGYELIVMSSDGPDNLYQFFSGSNTYHAIVKSEVPVLLVPAGYKYHSIKTAVYAFNYLKEQDLPLVGLLPVVRALKSKLTILRVMEEACSRKAEEEAEELQRIIRNFYPNDIFQFENVRSAEVAHSINRYIADSKADLLVLCSGHRSMLEKLFQESVIKQLTAYPEYPVLVFHD